MINRHISVHLQDFPDVSFLADEKKLVAEMDLVRAICSAALSIRDQKNLRVRLPLNQLTVIGKNAAQILPFKEILSEEVNVKSVTVEEEIGELAELKLQINFKKIGAKFGAKVKEINDLVRCGKWQKVSASEVLIGDGLIKLVGDEFEIKLISKNQNDKKFANLTLPTNDYMIRLDIEITKELEDEGIARDIVRAIQQNRKDADLNITDHIKLNIFSDNPRILSVAKSFEEYIKEQVLADILSYVKSEDEVRMKSKFSFQNQMDDGDLVTGISVPNYPS